jgi:hypothetical protein
MCKFGDSVSCPGLYGGLYGQNLPYKFKSSYGDFKNRNFEKSHRTTGPRPVRSETRFVILGKFWSRFDLQQRRNRKFLGDDQGCLSEQTVLFEEGAGRDVTKSTGIWFKNVIFGTFYG